MNILKYIFIFLLAFNLNANDDFEDFGEEFKEIPKDEEFFLLEGYNRAMTSFNDGTYVYVFKPVSEVIDYTIPKPVRVSVNNFFDNLKYPIRFVNALLQLKFEKAFIETERFIINSTIGIVGLFDFADSEFNLRTSPEDFGQTLAFYGVPAGPHIVLPLLGPSNLRDTIGLVPDVYIDPTFYNGERSYNLYNNQKNTFYFNTLREFNYGSINYKTYEMFRNDAVDLYPYLKTVYTKHREKLIEE